MLTQVLTIARNTFLESVRQPIYFVLLMAGWIFQVFNTLLSSYSLGYTDSAEVSSDNKLLLDIGLATVFVCATLLAAFLATAVLAREIENKTALTVISKPVGRPVFVLGKYLGVTAAIVVATIILLVFFEMALRHKVLSTARDRPDGPVLLFTFLMLAVSIGVGVWGNFFYGWVFSSTVVSVLLPASLLAWFAVLLIDKNWHIQPVTIATLKPEIKLAAACVLMAMPVLCAVAIAASTRLGQVMTITVCAGVFVLGLLSNHLFGSRAFKNHLVGVVKSAEPDRDLKGTLDAAGATWKVTFKEPAEVNIKPGDPFYYGPSPNGVALATPPHPGFDGDPTDPIAVVRDGQPASLVVRTVGERRAEYTIVNVNGLHVERPPREGDYVFLKPTTVNPVALGAWSLVPNMQSYWLVDAVTQNHPIPARYVGLVGLYSLVQIAALLALSVILFQRREVG